MSTQVSIAAAVTMVAPSAVQAPTETWWGPGLAIAAALLLMVGCVAGVGAGWWYLSERRRVRRCRGGLPMSPRPEAPLTTGTTLASQGGDLPVARPRSPRHAAASTSGSPARRRLASHSTSPQHSTTRAA
jgi:hypothetical protein